jgi:LPXTG-motif cell wall-anchored protein
VTRRNQTKRLRCALALTTSLVLVVGLAPQAWAQPTSEEEVDVAEGTSEEEVDVAQASPELNLDAGQPKTDLSADDTEQPASDLPAGDADSLEASQFQVGPDSEDEPAAEADQLDETADVGSDVETADLALFSDGPLIQGQESDLTLVVGNNGPSFALNPIVVDGTFVANSLVSASGEGWTCAITPATVQCSNDFVGLGMGDAGVINLTFSVDACPPPVDLWPVFSVSSSTTDPDLANNSTEPGCVAGASGGPVSGEPFDTPASNIGDGQPASGFASAPVVGNPFDTPPTNIGTDPQSTPDAPNRTSTLRRNELPQTGSTSTGPLSGLGVTLLIGGAGLISVARHREQFRGQAGPRQP